MAKAALNFFRVSLGPLLAAVEEPVLPVVVVELALLELLEAVELELVLLFWGAGVLDVAVLSLGADGVVVRVESLEVVLFRDMALS